MASREEFERAHLQYEKYWKPVAAMFERAATRRQIREACAEAEQATGMKYGFGIGFHGDPVREQDEAVSFHGWLYDEGHDMITVWYSHGDPHQ